MLQCLALLMQKQKLINLFHYKALFKLSLILLSKDKGEGSWLSHGMRWPLHFLWDACCPQTIVHHSFTRGERQSSNDHTRNWLSASLHGHDFFVSTVFLPGLKWLLMGMLVCGSEEGWWWPGPLGWRLTWLTAHYGVEIKQELLGWAWFVLSPFLELFPWRGRSLWSVTDWIYREIASASVEGGRKSKP